MRYLLALISLLWNAGVLASAKNLVFELPHFSVPVIYTAQAQKLMAFYERSFSLPFESLDLPVKRVYFNQRLLIVPKHEGDTLPSSRGGIATFIQDQNLKHGWANDQLGNFAYSTIIVPPSIFNAVKPTVSSPVISMLRCHDIEKMRLFFQTLTWQQENLSRTVHVYVSVTGYSQFCLSPIHYRDHYGATLTFMRKSDSDPRPMTMGDIWSMITRFDQDPDGHGVFWLKEKRLQ